jgi:hypothetical protein
MCGCKDCKEVTLLSGADGRGIVSITRNGNGTFTYLFTDGTIYVTPNLTGAEGPEGPQGPQGDPGINGTNSVVEYITALPGADTSGTEPTFTWLDPFVYTVPALTPTADYEITFIAAIAMTFDPGVKYHGVFANIYKNGTSIDPACIQGARAVTLENLPLAFSLTTSVIVSLSAGDDITIFSTSSKPSDAYIQSGIFKVTKLG